MIITFVLNFTRYFLLDDLRAQQPVFTGSMEAIDGLGESGGVLEGLVGAPLYADSISTNSRSCNEDIQIKGYMYLLQDCVTLSFQILKYNLTPVMKTLLHS
jgi:hypothetical protein